MMKKNIFSISFLLLVLCTSIAKAQVSHVTISARGKLEITVKVGERASVVLNEQGKIIKFNIHGDVSYYSDFHSYEAGKMKRAGNIDFSYYSDFHSYEAGKLKKAGNMPFSYYSNFHSYEAGKIKEIGNVKFSYYSDFHSYEAGKIKSIGNTAITYYSDFHNYEAGKLKSIGSISYKYNSNGQLQSGPNHTEQNGIRFGVRHSH